MELTRHFRERWQERVSGDMPDGKKVAEMIRGAIELQKFRQVYTPRGRVIRVLGTYWVPDRGLVIKADMKNLRAVTVITDECERVEEVQS